MVAPRRYRVAPGKALSLIKQWVSADDKRLAGKVRGPSITGMPLAALARPVSMHELPRFQGARSEIQTGVDHAGVARTGSHGEFRQRFRKEHN